MRYNGIIQRKLALLDSQLLKLKEHLGDVSYEEFEASWVLRSMTERALQVSVEIIIDVAERIIAIENAGPAATAAECVEKLVALKVLGSEAPFKRMVGFRNLIVHQYEVVDPELLFELATKRLDDFRLFIKTIDKANNKENRANDDDNHQHSSGVKL